MDPLCTTLHEFYCAAGGGGGVKAGLRYTLHIYYACSGICFGQLASLLGLLWYLLWSSSKANHFLSPRP